MNRLIVPASLKFASVLAIAFALCITGIRQNYDDSDLRAFLIPGENCPSPCFMNISIGTTERDRAIALLEEDEWVGEVYPHADGVYTNWTWSGRQPRFVNTWVTGFLVAETSFDEAYYEMTINSTIRLGELYLALGNPDVSYFARPQPWRSRALFHSVYYTRLGLLAVGRINCPIRLSRLSNIELFLSWGPLPDEEHALEEEGRTFPHYSRAWLDSLPTC